MNCTKPVVPNAHATDQTVLISSEAAAAAVRLAVIVLRFSAMRLPRPIRECLRHARDNRCRQRPKEGHA
jgi:hypothetical protein